MYLNTSTKDDMQYCKGNLIGVPITFINFLVLDTTKILELTNPLETIILIPQLLPCT